MNEEIKCSCAMSKIVCSVCGKDPMWATRCCNRKIDYPKKHASNCPRSMKLKRRKKRRERKKEIKND